jgi:hypothetical protein
LIHRIRREITFRDDTFFLACQWVVRSVTQCRNSERLDFSYNCMNLSFHQSLGVCVQLCVGGSFPFSLAQLYVPPPAHASATRGSILHWNLFSSPPPLPPPSPPPTSCPRTTAPMVIDWKKRRDINKNTISFFQ